MGLRTFVSRISARFQGGGSKPAVSGKQSVICDSFDAEDQVYIDEQALAHNEAQYDIEQDSVSKQMPAQSQNTVAFPEFGVSDTNEENHSELKLPEVVPEPFENAIEDLPSFSQVDLDEDEPFHLEQTADALSAEVQVEFDLVDDEFTNDSLFNEQVVSANDCSDSDDWDEYEHLDGYNGTINSFDAEPLPAGEGPERTTVKKTERARQVAIEVLDRYQWDVKHLEILEQIFIERGWGRCRVSIENLIRAGITPEELALVHELKSYWDENDLFQIFILVSGLNARYPAILSWAKAFALLRALDGIPDIDELVFWLDDAFDRWHNCPRMTRRFPTFLLFIQNQSIPAYGAVAGNTFFTFEVVRQLDFDGDRGAQEFADHYNPFGIAD